MPLLRNPVIKGKPETEELYRAFDNLIEQMQETEERAGRIVVVPLDVSAATDIVLIPRVGKEGFALGRVSFTLTADLTADSSAYWIFTLYRKMTRPSDGARISRSIAGFTWNNSTYGLTAYLPHAKQVRTPLRHTDSLVLGISVGAGSPSSFSGSVSVEETFGPEG